MKRKTLPGAAVAPAGHESYGGLSMTAAPVSAAAFGGLQRGEFVEALDEARRQRVARGRAPSQRGVEIAGPPVSHAEVR